MTDRTGTSHDARGSVFTALLAAAAFVGSLSYYTYQTLSGPVATMMHTTKKSYADSQMTTSARILIASALNTDCDTDNNIESPPFTTATGPAPVNGGWFPAAMGLPAADPWGTPYGYCVWDTGAANNPAVDNGCGAAANRLAGSPAPLSGHVVTQDVIAVISAGEDRMFQTTCNAYADATTGVIATTAGADDLVVRYSYADALRLAGDIWALRVDNPDEAETTKTLSVGDQSTTGVINALSIAVSGIISAGGGVQLADENAVTVCEDEEDAGALRYNAVDMSVEVCNGESWGSVGGDGDGGEGPTGVIGINDMTDGYAAYDTGYSVGIGLGAMGRGVRVVQETGIVSGDNAASLTLPFGKIPEAGSTIILMGVGRGEVYSTAGISDNHGGGGAYVPAVTAPEADGRVLHLFYRPNISTPGGAFTVTVAPDDGFINNGNNTAWKAMEVAGLAVAPLDQAAHVSDTLAAASSTTTLSGETSQAVALAIAGIVKGSDTDTLAPAAGWTEVFDQTGLSLTSKFAMRTLVETETLSHTWTHDSTGDRGHVLVTFAAKAPVARDSIVAVGENALLVNSTGDRNTAIGQEALAENISGSKNTALGYRAALNSATAHQGAVAGVEAMREAVSDGGGSGDNSGGMAVAGYRAAYLHNSGVADRENNAVAGYMAYASSLTGAENTALGAWALHGLVSSHGNVAIGYESLRVLNSTATEDGQGMTAAGYRSAASVVEGNNSVAIGAEALASSGAGVFANAVVFGYRAGMNVTTPADNVILGSQALLGASAPLSGVTGNVAVGYQSLMSAGDDTYGNVALGRRALSGAGTGAYNVVAGAGALENATASQSNIAIGYQAMHETTDAASYNILIGSGAGYALGGAGATGNVGIGYESLYNGVNTRQCVAIGYQALRAAAGIYGATAAGYQALPVYTGVADENAHTTAIGYQAMQNATTGLRNTAVGYQAMQNATTSSDNLAIGHQALSGITAGDGHNSVIGYRAGAGLTGESARAVAVGHNALAGTNGTSVQNNVTAIGAGALAGMTGVDNALDFSVAVGTGAGQNATVWFVAVGMQALAANSDENNSVNTALGYQALMANTTGSYNTAGGYQALRANIAGYNNTALGYQALLANTGGYNNTALGYQALLSNTGGAGHLAVGYQALRDVATNNRNTALGAQAGVATTGGWNTALGYQALSVNTTGQGNTAIGCSGPATSGLSNTTCIGYGAVPLASNSIRVGNDDVGWIGGQVGLSVSSDMRLKTDIADSDLGLGFVMRLHPVSYRMKKGDGLLDYGFIAQDVETALDGRDTNMVTRDEGPDRLYRLRATDLLAPVVKAVQEQADAADARAREIDALKAELAEIGKGVSP